jgi:hypothetical protein
VLAVLVQAVERAPAGAPAAAGDGTAAGAVRPEPTSTVAVLSLSLPFQFATTRPVASAVAATRQSPMLVSFYGLFQRSFSTFEALR